MEREASLLLTYVMSASGLAWTPEASDQERYRQALHAQLPVSHQLDPMVYQHPWLLGGLDAISRLLLPHSILQQKLIVAAALMEAHPASAPWLLPRDRNIVRWGLAVLRICLRIVGKLCIGLPLLLFPRFLRRNAGSV
jgi:hypothetical protein